jgi:hypothetical protein
VNSFEGLSGLNDKGGFVSAHGTEQQRLKKRKLRILQSYD